MTVTDGDATILSTGRTIHTKLSLTWLPMDGRVGIVALSSHFAMTNCTDHKPNMNAPAQFRKDHDAKGFIFQVNGMPWSIARLAGDPIDEGHGIHTAAAALVDSFFQEHGIAIGGCGEISPHDNRLGPGLDVTCFRRRCFRQRQQRRRAGRRCMCKMDRHCGDFSGACSGLNLISITSCAASLFEYRL